MLKKIYKEFHVGIYALSGGYQFKLFTLIKDRLIQAWLTMVIFNGGNEDNDITSIAGPVVSTVSPSSPPSRCDDRIPTVMYLCVCEGHPDRQGYHRHNLAAL